MEQLPQFRGYTVDTRLRQFRRVLRGRDGTLQGMSCIDFASELGLDLLTELVRELLTRPDDIA